MATVSKHLLWEGTLAPRKTTWATLELQHLPERAVLLRGAETQSKQFPASD